MKRLQIDDILKKIKNPDDIPLIQKAYEYAKKHLDGKIRANGETHLSHALEVTNILLGLNVDTTTIISSILHETCDIGDGLEEEIEKLFGKDVRVIVSSVSKINRLEMTDESDSSAIYLRKVMVGLCDDVRVLFIKLADRLHNMRTMEVFSKEHQRKVANETERVLVPIAHRLGINSIKSELENLCLYYTKPEVYNDILEKLNNTIEELNDYLEEMKESISRILKDNEIKFEIKGRVKSVYSIYNKLNNGKKWESIYDILALRVFVEKESECYAALGFIHSKYRPVPNRFKDYIAIPKENMYQSLHTTVIGPGGRYYEVQIRTYEMDEIAEKGIASHWSYKEKGTKKIQSMMEQKLELYRSIIENNDEKSDSEFEGAVDSNILTDLIYVYTPKGDVIELPAGSTPIDFAYRIHSKVGDSMVGAIVNDVMAPISSELHDQDVVKVMTSPTGKPNKDWLNMVKTSQAKDKIKAYFSKKDKEEYIARGKSILEKELRRRKMAINDFMSSDNINKICTGLKLKDQEELYLVIGAFRYTANFIINYVVAPEKTQDVMLLKRRYSKKVGSDFDILVDGKSSIQTHIAKCCMPVKGDEIVGVITKNDGIAIHRANCPNILGNNQKQITVCWNSEINNKYAAEILATYTTDKDKVSEIIQAVTSENVGVISVDEKNKGNYSIKINVEKTEDIDRVINAIRHLRYIKEVRRK